MDVQTRQRYSRQGNHKSENVSERHCTINMPLLVQQHVSVGTCFRFVYIRSLHNENVIMHQNRPKCGAVGTQFKLLRYLCKGKVVPVLLFN
jgi:hypothetical protein